MLLWVSHLEVHLSQSLLLWRMGANVFQGSEYGSWNWWRCGQMSSLRMETVLICSVDQLDQIAIVIVVGR